MTHPSHQLCQKASATAPALLEFSGDRHQQELLAGAGSDAHASESGDGKVFLMDRRRILLVVAVVVAAMGAALVFLYVKGADSRAEQRFDTVEVLRATSLIEAGESVEDAQAAGKLALQAVAKD